VRTAYQLQTAAAFEPVTVAEAMDHLNVTSTDKTKLIERTIRGARSRIEEYLRRGLITQTWKKSQDGFTDLMRLPMAAPLQSVTSVKYYDAAGVLQTLATSIYGVDTLSEPGFVYLKPNQVWPVLEAGRPLAVEIVYVVGWSAVDAIPPTILDQLYLLIGDRYEHREQTIVGTSAVKLPDDMERVLAGHRVYWPEDPVRDCALEEAAL
jgi:uncharacterized phiE125 gp8 family phage protein